MTQAFILVTCLELEGAGRLVALLLHKKCKHILFGLDLYIKRYQDIVTLY